MRQAVAGIVICVMLVQPGWTDSPCCCHDQLSPVPAGSLDSARSGSTCSQDEIAAGSCGSSCCYQSNASRRTGATAVAILSSSHDSIPHRCCRDYCQPVSSGGEESCSCEIEPSSLAIVSSARVETSPIAFLYWLDSSIDVDRSKCLSVVRRDDASLRGVKSPGRVHSVFFERWLI